MNSNTFALRDYSFFGNTDSSLRLVGIFFEGEKREPERKRATKFMIYEYANAH